MRIKLFRIIFTAIFSCLILFNFSFAQEKKRVILAFFDSSEEINSRLNYNLVHHAAEMALNHLGLTVRYFDIAKGLPREEEMRDVLAVLSWFKDDNIPHAKDYCLWASRQVKDGKKYIILGDFGAYKDTLTGEFTPLDVINQLFGSIGLEYSGDWTDNPFVIELVKKDPRMVEFERTLENEIGAYERVKSINPSNKVYLQLKRTDLADSISDMVVTTSNGAFASDDYEIFIDYASDKMQWRINPFLFFEEALGLKDELRFDTTTLFGRRIFYSHIDGDGIRNVSSIDNRSYCGEIIFEEIFKKYELPITASFITADIDPKYFGNSRLLKLAEEIVKLDNLEIGNHSFSHPLDWERELTAYAIKGYSHKVIGGEELEILSESPYGEAAIVTVGKNNFLKKEIIYSSKYIDSNLSSSGKETVIFQWTGNCRPPAQAVTMADELKIENINGGDTRFDSLLPSYTGVAPLTRSLENRRIQVYTSNANENIYTNGWKGPFDGFKYVIDTFQQTENPTLIEAAARRVSPINVYYHFFSAEKDISLKALKEVYDYALTQEIIPIFTSDYAKIVRGFFSAKINSIGQDVWELSDFGACRTVRFDRQDIYPDLQKSDGILGFRQWENCLYIYLADQEKVVLHLTKNPPKEPFLKESSAVLNNCKIRKEEIDFKTRLFRKGIFKFTNLNGGKKYLVKANELDKGLLFEEEFKSTDRGELEIFIPLKGNITVKVKQQD